MTSARNLTQQRAPGRNVTARNPYEKLDQVRRDLASSADRIVHCHVAGPRWACSSAPRPTDTQLESSRDCGLGRDWNLEHGRRRVGELPDLLSSLEQRRFAVERR